MQIANVEPDKASISDLNDDLHKELLVVQSMQSQQGSDGVNQLLDHVTAGFDARNVLPANSEIGEFWVSSFGKEAHEVQWQRFRVAFNGFFGKSTDKELKRMKLMLIDLRGNVTLETLKAFTINTGGSLRTALSSMKKGLPKNILDVGAELSNVVSSPTLTSAIPTVEKIRSAANGTTITKRPATTGVALDLPNSPTETRQSRLRLYGVVDSS